MKTVEELNRFFEKELKPDLMKLDEQRVAIQKKLVPLLAVCVVIVIVSFGLIVYFKVSLMAMIVPLAICLILVGGWYTQFYRGFASRFKEQVIQKIVTFIEPGLSYDKDKCVPKALFLESNIFQERADRYHGDDFVSGRIGETDIQFSELSVKRVEKTHDTSRTGSDRRTKTTNYPIFRGLFFVARFNKNFKKRTVVLPDTAEKLFGRWGQKLQSLNPFRGAELVKLEDPEFEKLFVVYGEDQIESRYVLSTSLMERIVRFRHKTRQEIFLSFVASQLFVAIAYERALFEPGIFKSLVDLETIQTYFEDLKMAIGIVDDLNLNTRIWRLKEGGSHGSE